MHDESLNQVYVRSQCLTPHVYVQLLQRVWKISLCSFALWRVFGAEVDDAAAFLDCCKLNLSPDSTCALLRFS